MSPRTVIIPAAVTIAMLAGSQPALARPQAEIRVSPGLVAGTAERSGDPEALGASKPAAGVDRPLELPEQPVAHSGPTIETAVEATGHALVKSTEWTARYTEAAGKVLFRMLEQARPGPLLPPPESWR